MSQQPEQSREMLTRSTSAGFEYGGKEPEAKKYMQLLGQEDILGKDKTDILP